MDDEIYLLCSTPPEAKLNDAEELTRLLDFLVQNGFFLYAGAEDQPVFLAMLHYARPEALAGDTEEQQAKRRLAAPYIQQITRPGITDQLRQEALAFTSSSATALEIRAQGTSHAGDLQHFAFTLSITPEDHYVTLQYSTASFARKATVEESVRAYEQWLAVCIACYLFSRAIYAYEWNSNGSIATTDEEDLEQRKPSMLYEVNFFGPEMVANLGGLAYVQQTPAQIVRPLENGGAMVLPKVAWYPASSPSTYSWAKAAKHLHVIKPDFIQDDDDNEE